MSLNKRYLIHHFYKLKTKLFSNPAAPSSFLLADIFEALKNPHKAIIIITNDLVFIGYESSKRGTHKRINIIVALFVIGSLDLLQPYIKSYLSNPKKNAPKFIYYHHKNSWHLVPINRFLIHSPSPQA